MHSSRIRRLCGSLTATLLLSLFDPFVPVSRAQEIEVPDIEDEPAELAEEPVPAEAPEAEAPAPDAEPEVEVPEAPPPAPVAVPPTPPETAEPVVETAPPAGPPRAEAQADEGAENIVVTGSRIARSSLTSYGNITVIDSEQIRAVGAVTIDDLLRRLPSTTLQGISANQNNGGLGFRTLELRNLGNDRTLVLVNGRRYIQQGTVFNGQFVDINDIPTQLIERIEILFDGASAIYGSDAVAGVVNFVLKDEFEGFETEVQGNITDEGDGEQITVAVTGGVSNARGNFVVNASYNGYAAVEQPARGWGRADVVGALDEETFVYGSSFVPESRIGGNFFRPDPTTGRSYQAFRSAGIDQRYNFSDRQFLFGSQDRFSIHGLGKYDLIDEKELTMEAFLETNFIHRTTRTRLAPQPITDEVRVSTDLMPEDYAATLAPGTLSQVTARRMVDVGDRIFELQSFSMRQLLGIRGEILELVDYEIFGQYTRNRSLQQTFNSIDIARANETANPELCALNAGRGCVLGNWFGPGALSGDAADYMRFVETTVTEDEMINFASIFGVELFAIPSTTKKISLSAGYEYRRMYGLNRPGSIVARGDSAGNASTVTTGDFDTNEVFAEILVPLVSDLPAVYDLGVDGAIRSSSFSTFGTETTFRARARYAPVRDLAFRGTYSTAFRAPNVGELFGGVTESFEVLDDPCDGLGPNTPDTVRENCLSQGVPLGYNQAVAQGSQLPTNIGGNENLEEETSNSYNLGVVLTTSFLPEVLGRFSATFDYYAYEVDNAVGTIPGQIALDRCYESAGLSSEFCNLITRGPGGTITNFDLSNLNLGSITTSGFDFSAEYSYDFSKVGLQDVGRVSLGFAGNYMIDFDNLPFEGGELVELAGTADTSEGIYPTLTWRASAMWSLGDFTLSGFVTYIDGMDVLGAQPDDFFTTMGSIAYTDLSVTWVYDQLMLVGGVTNLTDESPPFLLGGFANSAPQGYEFYGRYFFLRARYTF